MSAALAFLPVNAQAQANFASVSGEVLDAQEAAIPGAAMTLISPSNGLRRSTVSNGTGFYDFTDVNPGDYQLRVEAPGFQTELRSFVLAVNQVLRLDLTLQVGSKTQQVIVKGVPPPLRTTDATLGEVIDPTLTGQLPLDGRHVLDLAIMALLLPRTWAWVSRMEIKTNSIGGLGRELHSLLPETALMQTITCLTARRIQTRPSGPYL